MTQCDKQLKTYIIDNNWNNVGLATNYLMSDVACMPRPIWVAVSRTTLMPS